MKTGAILAAMAMAITPALAEISADFDPAAMHHMAAKDPCTNMDKRECMRDDACQYYRGPRNTDLSRKESGGRHHSAAEGEDGCAAKHLFERVSQSTASDKKSMLSKHGFHSTWDTIECSEAFYMKDCKDLNQNNENQCAWTCGNGCTDYDGERRVLDPCEEAPPIYVDLYAEANYFLGYPSTDRSCAQEYISKIPGVTADMYSTAESMDMDTLFPLAYNFCTTHGSCIAEVNGGLHPEMGSDYPGHDHLALEDMIVQISSDPGWTLGDMEIKCIVHEKIDDQFQCGQAYTNFMHPDSPLLESIIAGMTSAACDFAPDARAFPDGFHVLEEGVGGQYDWHAPA